SFNHRKKPHLWPLPVQVLPRGHQSPFMSGFSVKGPVEPIMVLLGANATLPCQLSPEQSAADMHIRWYRTQFFPAVFVYQNGQEQGGEQMLEYHGRTELVRDSINRGGVALLIQHVRASDHGQYQCHFKDGQSSQEAIVELHVIGLGSVPHVHMMGPEDGGIRVLCSSDGWFPKPKVQWNDMLGVNLQSLSESQTQDEDGLFHVEASLVVMDSSLGNVTCSIQNPLSGQEKVSCIFLPEPFFPKMDPWKAALAGTVPVLMLLLIGISYTGWREHQAKEKEVKKKKRELNERDQMKNEKEMAQKATDWRKAQLYAVHLSAVNVTLDAATAHPSLLLSEDRRQVTWQEEHQDLPSSTQRFHSYPCVLGQLHISSGRAHWEVKVEGALSWDLGICIDNVTRKGSITVSPQNGFWAIRLYKGEYWALTSPETCLTIREKPLSVGIFLDYDAGDVSYYNMTDGSHIFSFTQITFSRAIRPLFRLWSPDSGSLTICGEQCNSYNIFDYVIRHGWQRTQNELGFLTASWN
uniref:Uncharacterized protein n=1 Tax=Canis lupus familiaris TaxID=9615 RepID=A0A8C0T397_CANLF